MENNIDIAYLAKFLETQMEKSSPTTPAIKKKAIVHATDKNWAYDIPTTDAEAIEFLHYGKNPEMYPSMDALYKINREHHKMEILDAIKDVLLLCVQNRDSGRSAK